MTGGKRRTGPEEQGKGIGPSTGETYGGENQKDREMREKNGGLTVCRNQHYPHETIGKTTAEGLGDGGKGGTNSPSASSKK